MVPRTWKRCDPIASGSTLMMICLVAVSILSFSTAEGAPPSGAIAVHPANPFYFQDVKGNPVVLVGDYTWGTFSDVDFDYERMFDSLKSRGLNFARVWLWWGAEEFPEPDGNRHFEPYLRSGPGTANDGRPKYDLTKFDPRYFEQLRNLCAAARKRGLFLQLITVDAWMIKHPHLWRLHGFHRDNNINGVDGDPNNTGRGTDGKQGFCSMGNPEALKFQKEYIRKVVDTTNEFDNIYYEIANENYYSTDWELALCDSIKEYEKSKPKQHLTMPRDLPSHSSVVQNWDPKVVHAGMLARRSLKQPLIFDTDWTINKNDDEVRKAMWAGVISGGHFNYMDDSMEFRTKPVEDKRVRLHKQIDYMAAFIKKIKPWEMEPDDSLVKSGDAFAMVSTKELAAYLPYGGSATLDLTKMPCTLKSWWYNPVDGRLGKEFTVQGGRESDLTAPDKNDWALLIRKGNDR